MQQHARRTKGAANRSLLWRIHFWAALIASPFTLVAAVTGLLYVFTPQIEAARHGWLDHVAPAAARQRLDQSVAAARAVAPPGSRVKSVLPPYAAGDTVRVLFEQERAPAAGHAAHHPAAPGQGSAVAAPPFTVYVNPYTARVIGTLANQDRFSNWSQRLHSRLLQTDSWRWMIELAASAMLVMLLTGVALWWSAASGPSVPRASARGRVAWQQWHAFLGVALAIVTVAILATGLTWSQYAGAQIRAARDVLGQAPPRSPGNLKSNIAHAQSALTWEAAWELTRRLAPDVAVQLTPPRSDADVWRISAADPSRPTRRFDLVLDGFDGKPLYQAGWAQQTAFGKATALGIPFHRGEYGWWNQLVLLLCGGGVLFSLLSGWVMYFKRRQRGAPGLPRLPAGAWKAAALPLGLSTLLLAVLMPVLGVAACAVLLLECWLHGRQRA
jgi:uncharacterized iron-regulated membrane protein